MHWSTRRSAVAALLTFSLLAATGCSAASGATGEVYRIGVVTSQTGLGSQLGVGELAGARQAADLVNSRGGVNGHKIEIVAADDQSSPAQAVLQTRRLLTSVDAFVGPSLSGPCKAIGPLVDSEKIVDYCLSPGLKPTGYQWSASAATPDLTARLIAYWKKQGITRIGLAYSSDSSGVDGAKALRESVAAAGGVQITASTAFSSDAVSVTSQVQALIAGRPQAVVVWSTGAGAAVFFKGLQQGGLSVPVATTDGNLTYAFLKRIQGFVPQPLLIPATRDFWYEQSPRSDTAAALEKDYHDTYDAQHGQQPDFGPGVAFDAVLLIARALGKAGGDRHAVKAALESTTGAEGVVGTYNFSPTDHRGLSEDDVAIVRAAGNQFVYVGR